MDAVSGATERPWPHRSRVVTHGYEDIYRRSTPDAKIFQNGISPKVAKNHYLSQFQNYLSPIIEIVYPTSIIFYGLVRREAGIADFSSGLPLAVDRLAHHGYSCGRPAWGAGGVMPGPSSVPSLMRSGGRPTISKVAEAMLMPAASSPWRMSRLMASFCSRTP